MIDRSIFRISLWLHSPKFWPVWELLGQTMSTWPIFQQGQKIKQFIKLFFNFPNLLLSKGTEMNELLQENLRNIRSPTQVFTKRVFQVRGRIVLFSIKFSHWHSGDSGQIDCPWWDQTAQFYLELTKCSMFNKAWDFKINLEFLEALISRLQF